MRTRAGVDQAPPATVMSVLELVLFPFRGPGGFLWPACALGLHAYGSLLHGASAFEEMRLVAYLFLPLPIVILFLVLQLHAWRVLQRLALGHVRPEPGISVADISPFQDPLAFQVAVLLCALGGSVVALNEVDGALGMFFAGAVALVLPAFLGVVSIDHGLFDALHPRRLWRFIGGLGIAYLPFAIVLCAAFGALAFAGILQSPTRGSLTFAATYLFVFAHAAAGRLLYLKRDAIGLATVVPATPAQREVREIAEAVDDLMLHMHRLCMGGQVRRAARELEDFLRERDYALDEHVHERVQLLHDQRLLVAHADHYAARLVAAGKPLPAWRVLRRALAVDPDFRPTESHVLLAAVTHAPAHDAGVVATVLGDFERVYAGDEHVPDALFEHARWCVQHLERPEDALRLVTRIEREFPATANLPAFGTFAARLRRHVPGAASPSELP